MTPYLTDEEITKYTKLPGLTMNEVEQASVIIDSYIGRSFGTVTHIEQAKLSKKNSSYGKVCKGKLRHSPRISVIEVTAQVPSYFGGLQTTEYGTDSLWFDDEDFEYFTFMQPSMVNMQTSIVGQSIFATQMPSVITVKYTSGYDEIPEEIKRACGMIMDAMKSNGGTVAWKSRQDFDMTVVLRDSEDPIMTNTVIRLLTSVKLS